ncbi:PepSY-associated TM helix domain-containing protein [Marinobacter sp. ANT_B65]|uniref:PepSY-associated TM helix domain-containing protein n=1 Tax=Marinobacter sp. ANT_B65 TaxID=2039467 RepID=UPI000BBE927D|nr:PepSY-associated TM helix domain-containing protein [Marinobacter sp. ANT_B65]PCM45614.1 hypothetical protein CPA50_06450 [Marinobacter sp. ANT_B65]
MTDTVSSRVSGNHDRAGQSRSRWLKLCLRWHWISSAVALFGMLLFAITGITLNHAGQIGAAPQVVVIEDTLSEELVQHLSASQSRANGRVPAELAGWLASEHHVSLTGGVAEWSDYELYISQPRPGGDAWLSVDLETAEVVYESTDRGWIAWLNDLHKGRNTGDAWVWFIDIFALVCVVFCVTGFGVLWIHSRERPAIWPVVGAGILIPVLLVALFVH